MAREEQRLSLREAADALGISEVSARRWIKSGKLFAHQPGRSYQVPREAVDQLLGRNPAEPERLSLAWARAAGEVEFYREISGAPGEDDERLARLLGELDRFVWRPWRAAIGKKNAAIRGGTPADAAAGPEPAGPDELELVRGRRNALRDEVRRRIPPFARVRMSAEGNSCRWLIPPDNWEQHRACVDEFFEGEEYRDIDARAAADVPEETALYA